jgi:hypothetical protein
MMLLILAMPALADTVPIPTYNYFYPCSSGVVDCSSFSKHWYGDFGLTGVTPVELQSLLGPTSTGAIISSNARGQVVGNISDARLFNDGTPTFGYAGEMHCFGGSCSDTSFRFTDINDKGLAVGFEQIGPGVLLIANFDANYWPLSLNTFGTGYTAVGRSVLINDFDMVLVNAQPLVGGPTILGVFSPTPIPEPASVLLLGTVIAVFSFSIRRQRAKKRSQATVA